MTRRVKLGETETHLSALLAADAGEDLVIFRGATPITRVAREALARRRRRRSRTMPLTRDFKLTVRERLQRDPSFREALLEEVADCLLAGDVATGKSLLRDHVTATSGSGEHGSNAK